MHREMYTDTATAPDASTAPVAALADCQMHCTAVSEWSDFDDCRRGVIRVYDVSGNVIETHEHAGEFKEW